MHPLIITVHAVIDEGSIFVSGAYGWTGKMLQTDALQSVARRPLISNPHSHNPIKHRLSDHRDSCKRLFHLFLKIKKQWKGKQTSFFFFYLCFSIARLNYFMHKQLLEEKKKSTHGRILVCQKAVAQWYQCKVHDSLACWKAICKRAVLNFSVSHTHLHLSQSPFTGPPVMSRRRAKNSCWERSGWGEVGNRGREWEIKQWWNESKWDKQGRKIKEGRNVKAVLGDWGENIERR